MDKILVIEDDEKNLTSLIQLRIAKHQVDTANTYNEAIRKLTGNAKDSLDSRDFMRNAERKKYDVVLTDLMIPLGADGVTLMNRSEQTVPTPLGYGIIFAASRLNIPLIGLLTNMNHHSSAVAATFDQISGRLDGESYIKGEGDYGRIRPMIKINDTLVVLCDSGDGFESDGVKDYAALYRAVKNTRK